MKNLGQKLVGLISVSSLICFIGNTLVKDIFQSISIQLKHDILYNCFLKIKMFSSNYQFLNLVINF